jgi:hypothetical protein
MTDNDPNLVISSASQKVLVDGQPSSIEIFRLEHEELWTLEVIDRDGTSHVWDDRFASDMDARDRAIADLEAEGAAGFMRGDNVVPFR